MRSDFFDAIADREQRQRQKETKYYAGRRLERIQEKLLSFHQKIFTKAVSFCRLRI
jgi:hypothetical protein